MEQNYSRHIDFEGAYNTRDTGGYETTDGHRVRWRTLFRSDSLHALTPESQQLLLSQGIRTVIDLRTDKSAAEQPNVFEDSSEVDYQHINVMGDESIVDVIDTTAGSSSATKPPDIYSAILDKRIGMVGQVIKTLAKPNALPALYHCNSGRDRAGLTTMLALGIAGVKSETISEDYTLTAHYLWRRTIGVSVGRWIMLEPDEYHANPEYQQAFDDQARICPMEAMQGTLYHLEKVYGGIRAYLLKAGVTESELGSLRESLIE